MRYIAIDLETNGLNPLTGIIFMLSVTEGKKTNVYHNCSGMSLSDLPKQLIKDIQDKNVCKIIHNSLFDCPFMELQWGIKTRNIHDTELCESIIQSFQFSSKLKNIPKGSAVDKMLRQYNTALRYVLPRYGFPEPNKDIRKNFIDRPLGKKFTKEEIKYAGDDTKYLPAIQKAQEYLLKRDNLIELAHLENLVSERYHDMKVRGIGFDKNIWKRVADENIREHNKRMAKLPKDVENWNSEKQVKKYFYSKGILIDSYRNIDEIYLQTKNKTLGNFIYAREFHKAVTSYGYNWFEPFKDKEGRLKHYIDPDGRIRAGFRQIINTGRNSCIEQHQKVLFPGGSAPIKDIKVGQYVYCYDSKGNVRISKVTDVIDNGTKNLVRINWQSSGTGKMGTLVCTPDHKIKVKGRGWIQARNLKRYDKVFHLRVSNTGQRPRLYGSNGFCAHEHAFIKKEYYGGSNRDHAHHIDEDKFNNLISNIEVLTSKEHTNKHKRSFESYSVSSKKGTATKKQNGHVWKGHPRYSFTKYEFLKLLLIHGGRLTDMPMDFGVVKKFMRLHNIPVDICHKRWNSDREFLTRGIIVRTKLNDYSSLKIGWRSLKSLKLHYENHMVQSVEDYGAGKVYDLTVEKYHNFITEELCVHNCFDPNLQQLPGKGNIDFFHQQVMDAIRKSLGDDKHKWKHREAFVPGKGNVFIKADFSGQEIGVMAAMANERLWIDAMLRGDDVHGLTASIINPTQWAAAKERGCTFPKKCKCEGHILQREVAKINNFLLAYGGGPQRLAKNTGMTEMAARMYVAAHKRVIPNLTRALEKNGRDALATGVTYSASPYRRRRFLMKEEGWQIENQGKNSPIQMAGADLLKLAMASIPDWIPIVLVIHDEIVAEVPKKDAKKAAKVMKEVMEKSSDYVTGIKGLIRAEPEICLNLMK